MPLPIPEVSRVETHTRRVRYEGYKRADGLWDIEAHLTDVKNQDYQLKTGVRRAGQAVHEMWVRITIDTDFNVKDAIAVSDAVPYAGGCDAIVPAYRKLIGMNLLKGFRKQVRDRLGGIRGCTHLTEMLAGLPSAAIQTFAGETGEERADGSRPFQLDQCYAMDTKGETVRKLYPKWYAARKGASA